MGCPFRKPCWAWATRPSKQSRKQNLPADARMRLSAPAIERGRVFSGRQSSPKPCRLSLAFFWEEERSGTVEVE
eukprot:8831538-Alexandrium_andersonii.AAC.1